MKAFDEMYDELQNVQNSELGQLLEEAVQEKKKINKITLILCLIIDVIIIFYFGGFNALMRSTGLSFPIVFPAIIVILVVDVIIYALVYVIFGKKNREYVIKYKNILITRLMNNFYTNVEYFPDKEMPQYIYDQGRYPERYNEYNSEDYLEAQIDGKYSLQMAEVKTVEVTTRRDSDGDTHTERDTKFYGLFAKIMMDKSINSELRVVENGKMFLDSNRLKMDSSEFEKYFDVEATNQIIGMQLLTADVMEELIEFKNKTNTRYEIGIDNNVLYLRFHCGDMFEPQKIKQKELDRKSMEEYFNMLNFTYNLSNKIIKLVEETEI